MIPTTNRRLPKPSVKDAIQKYRAIDFLNAIRFTKANHYLNLLLVIGHFNWVQGLFLRKKAALKPKPRLMIKKKKPRLQARRKYLRAHEHQHTQSPATKPSLFSYQKDAHCTFFKAVKTPIPLHQDEAHSPHHPYNNG